MFAPWYVSPVTSRRGDSSLRSGNVGHTQASCLVLGVTLPANSRISFSLRVEAGFIIQGLSVFADNQRLLENFSAADWTQQRYRVSSRISSLTWCYHKTPTAIDGGTGIDDETGWLDALAFTSADIVSFCDVLDLHSAPCTLIRTVTYDPPQNRWESTTTDSLRGTSALVTPPLDMGQNACVTIEFNDALSADNYLAFSWRVTSQFKQDILRFQAGNQQRQINNASQWQTEYIDLDSSENIVRWCYSRSSAEDRQTARAWLDSLLIVTPADRYAVQIAVTSSPTVPPARTDSFQFQVTVTARSPTLPPPSDWVLIASGIDNISGADTTYALVFSGDPASGNSTVNVIATPDNPLLPSTVHFTLADRPSFFGTTAPMIRYSLPARELAMLQLVAPSTATQAVPDTPIEIAVTVAATDNSDIPVSPSGLTLMIEGTGNADVTQSTYVLSFTAGTAQTTIAVSLITRGNTGSIEVSVTRGDIVTTASIFLNPAPRKLASITVAAASSLVQTAADTPVTAELILTALDNYGDPTEGGSIDLQLSASNGAMVQSSLTLIIDATGSTRQTVEILPQNDLDTTVTVQLSRGSQDQSVQLLPDGGIQIVVRALRVLRQLQLSLDDRTSPLQQADSSLPIRANIRLIGLDQYDQLIGFPETTLTATTEPATTAVTLNPPQLSSAQPAGAITVLVVEFPETMATTTTVTISVANPGTDVTTNALVVLALPDTRPPLPSLNIDSDPNITELDLIVALRYMSDPQSSTASLAVNLMVTTDNITTTGLANLQRLFTNPVFLDRVDLNGDERVDQLDLRILLRYLSGLPGTLRAEQEASLEIIQLLLGLEQP